MVRAARLPGAARNIFCGDMGHVFGMEDAGRRDSGSFGRTGHYLYRISGAGAAGGRGPDNLSAHHCHAKRTPIESCTWPLQLRRVVRICHFRDGTDIYWARSRVLEYLSFAASRLPDNVKPSLGPDATGVGWVYQYVVTAGNRTLDELRAIQDWFLRYQLTSAEGVSEVASVGGFVKTYQVTVDPRSLQAYGIPLKKVSEVIAASNRDVGGRVIEMAETEYRVRGKGYLRGIGDLENLVVSAEK